MCTIYKSWICPTLDYGIILYSGVANTYLHCLDDLQSRIEKSCSFVFQPLSHCRNAAITLTRMGSSSEFYHTVNTGDFLRLKVLLFILVICC